MKRIAIIGSGGAGKSTLARQLSDRLEIEVYHLDAMLWKPNWILTTREEQKEIQTGLTDKTSWIIDGNYGATINMRLDAADTIIFLDIHRVICLYRAIKRVFKYWNRTRPDMAEGCNERFDFQFLKWIWQFSKKKRPDIIRMLDQLPVEKHVIILSSRKEVKAFINHL